MVSWRSCSVCWQHGRAVHQRKRLHLSPHPRVFEQITQQNLHALGAIDSIANKFICLGIEFSLIAFGQELQETGYRAQRFLQVVRDHVAKLLQSLIRALQLRRLGASLSSTCLRSVMSRAIFEAPMIVPRALRIGEMVTDTSSNRPSLVRRTVSKWLYALASSQARQNHALLLLPIVRQQAEDWLPDHLLCPVAEDALCGDIPAGHHPVQGFADDGVI